MTSTDVVGVKALEDRVRSKIHESIGDLIHQDDIKAIVERGIDDFLFKPRVVESNNGWGSGGKTKISLVQEVIEQKLEEQVRVAIDVWLRQNPEKIQEMLDQAIAKGVGTAIMRTLDMRFESLFESAAQNLRNQGLLSLP